MFNLVLPEQKTRRPTVFLLKSGVFWDVKPCGSCKIEVSEELSASFISVTRIGELGTTLAVTSNRRRLRRNAKSVFTRATRRNIAEDTILHSHRRENLKSYTVFLLLHTIIIAADQQ
jgi:hypothetical protein